MPKLSFDYAKLCADVRFRALVRRVGSNGEALDRLLRFWDQALTHWGRGRSLLPSSQFDLDPELAVLLEVQLAERRDGGIYAKGAELHFDWYAERLESASKAGKASAERRRLKFGTAQPSSNQTFGVGSENVEPNTNATLEVGAPNPNASSSASSSTSHTSTPPIVPQASPPPELPRMNRDEDRARKAIETELVAFAAAAAQDAFVVAESVHDPHDERASTAWRQLDASTRKIILATYGGADGFGNLIRAIKLHRRTKSPDSKFTAELRSKFVAAVMAKPELRPQKLPDLVATLVSPEFKNTQQEASP